MIRSRLDSFYNYIFKQNHLPAWIIYLNREVSLEFWHGRWCVSVHYLCLIFSGWGRYFFTYYPFGLLPLFVDFDNFLQL